jgi:hypothetical protein
LDYALKARESIMGVRLGIVEVIGIENGLMGEGGLLRLTERIGALYLFVKIDGEVVEWVVVWWEIRYYCWGSWVS